MPLPAPYAPPWKRLGEDGVALLAWLGLKLRELWRRNREGTLPLPGFWPRRWPRLFWPLVVVALLLGSGLVGRAWLSWPAAAPLGTEPLGTKPLGTEPPLGAEPPLGGTSSRDANTPLAATPDRDGGRPAPGGPSAGALPEAATGGPVDSSDSPAAGSDDAATARSADATPLPQTTESPEEREANRLRAAWSAGDPEPLIAAIRPEPASATLTLDLADAFIALKDGERQRLAERWWQRAVEEGYGHLRLRDGRGRLLARDARVGGGMVVLEPPGESGEAP